MPKRLITVAIALAFIAAIALISSNPPSAKRRMAPPTNAVAVDVMPITARSYTIKVDSYGRVRPRTQSQLLPQVAGQIIWVSENFRDGGFFEQGQELLHIDDSDYQLALVNAQANLAVAKQNLSEEQARVSQAKADWKRSGKRGQAPAIVLRQPQLDAASANVAAAEASLKQAQLNLRRTKVLAPYAGRVLSKSVDVGQLVNSSTVLASLYASDSIEVRLPIRSRDLAFVALPEKYRFEQASDSLPAVRFTSELMGLERWSGQLIETEAAIDDASRQLYVLAEIKDPYGAAAIDANQRKKAPLKIGQYVTAEITGRTLNNAIVIPNRLIYQGSYVYLEVDGTLQRRNVDIAWQNADEAVIAQGLAVGDRLITTNLGQLLSGTPVRLLDDKAAPKAKRPGVMVGEQGKLPQTGRPGQSVGAAKTKAAPTKTTPTKTTPSFTTTKPGGAS